MPPIGQAGCGAIARPLLAASCLMLACGGRTDLLELRGTDGPGTGEPVGSVSSSASCGPLALTIATRASCAIAVVPGFSVDAEGFISVAGKRHRVFALAR